MSLPAEADVVNLAIVQLSIGCALLPDLVADLTAVLTQSTRQAAAEAPNSLPYSRIRIPIVQEYGADDLSQLLLQDLWRLTPLNVAVVPS